MSPGGTHQPLNLASSKQNGGNIVSKGLGLGRSSQMVFFFFFLFLSGKSSVCCFHHPTFLTWPIQVDKTVAKPWHVRLPAFTENQQKQLRTCTLAFAGTGLPISHMLCSHFFFFFCLVQGFNFIFHFSSGWKVCIVYIVQVRLRT